MKCYSLLGMKIGFFFVVVFFTTSYSMSQNQIQTTTVVSDSELTALVKRIQVDADEVSFKLKQYLPIYIQNKDTASVLKIYIGLSDAERFRGNYELAFNHLWDALLYANSGLYVSFKVQIYRNLGILFDIYNKDDKALEYLQESLGLAKLMALQGKGVNAEFIASYFSLSNHYKNLKKYDMAMLYLDSCEVYSTTKHRQPFVDAERGYLYLKQGDFIKAGYNLFVALNGIVDKKTRYHIVILSYVGDLKMAEGELDSAMFYYKRSLEEMDKFSSFIEFKPELLQKVSNLYYLDGRHKVAYDYLLASKSASDTLFNLSNKRNADLFEVKNKYKSELIDREAFILKQDYKLKEKTTTQRYLLVLLGFIMVLSILLYFVVKQRLRLKKHTLTQALEDDKQRAVWEVKNKELAAYALQLIEKDQSITELLDVVKEKDRNSFISLQNKHLKAKINLWDNFNIRFLELNEAFYTNLRLKHPDLTSTEQKHCALIKLNFDSNEMAQILNISTQSVHTSRYRIRKKMDLDHNASLGDYISQF